MDANDVPALWTIYGDPEVMRYTSDGTFANLDTVHQMLASVGHKRAAGESLEWGIDQKLENRLIGSCGLFGFDHSMDSATVGCLLAREFWGRGYMFEVLSSLFEYASDELGIKRIQAEIDAPNLQSIRLFAKLGFRHREGDFYERKLDPKHELRIE